MKQSTKKLFSKMSSSEPVLKEAKEELSKDGRRSFLKKAASEAFHWGHLHLPRLRKLWLILPKKLTGILRHPILKLLTCVLRI